MVITLSVISCLIHFVSSNEVDGISSLFAHNYKTVYPSLNSPYASCILSHIDVDPALPTFDRRLIPVPYASYCAVRLRISGGCVAVPGCVLSHLVLMRSGHTSCLYVTSNPTRPVDFYVPVSPYALSIQSGSFTCSPNRVSPITITGLRPNVKDPNVLVVWYQMRPYLYTSRCLDLALMYSHHLDGVPLYVESPSQDCLLDYADGVLSSTCDRFIMDSCSVRDVHGLSDLKSALFVALSVSVTYYLDRSVNDIALLDRSCSDYSPVSPPIPFTVGGYTSCNLASLAPVTVTSSHVSTHSRGLYFMKHDSVPARSPPVNTSNSESHISSLITTLKDAYTSVHHPFASLLAELRSIISAFRSFHIDTFIENIVASIIKSLRYHIVDPVFARISPVLRSFIHDSVDILVSRMSHLPSSVLSIVSTIPLPDFVVLFIVAFVYAMMHGTTVFQSIMFAASLTYVSEFTLSSDINRDYSAPVVVRPLKCYARQLKELQGQ